MKALRRYLPILDWGAQYTGKTFTNDLIVGEAHHRDVSECDRQEGSR